MSYVPRPYMRRPSTRGRSAPSGPAEPDRVHVRVQHQRAPAARAAHATDHVRASRRELLELDLHAALLEPGRHEAPGLELARAARDERRVHGVDRDELLEEIDRLAHGRERNLRAWVRSTSLS